MESAEQTYTVEQAGLACTMKSGSLPVLATPMLIAWMEQTACLLVHAEPGMSSVGIEMNMSHLAPSPLGAQVCIKAMLKERKGKIFTFEIEAYMGPVLVSKAIHKRALVEDSRFLQKVYPDGLLQEPQL